MPWSSSKKLAIGIAASVSAVVAIWLFSVPSLFIGQTTLQFIERNRKMLVKVIEESKCDPQRVRTAIDELARHSKFDVKALEELGVGPASSKGAEDCFLQVVSGYDAVFLYDPKRDCWIFDRPRIGLLARCGM